MPNVRRIRPQLPIGSSASQQIRGAAEEPMESISLGAGGPQVSRAGLGLMSMSGIYGPADEAERVATINAALDAGIKLLDTGDFYGMGHNELLLRDARDDPGGLRPLPRPVGGGRRHHPAGARRAPGERAADRVLADEPWRRGRDPADGPRARHRRHRLREPVPRPAVDGERPRDRPRRPAVALPAVPARE